MSSVIICKRAAKAEVIWDVDHGTKSEGWYVRLHLTDGTFVDHSIKARRDIGIARARRVAIEAAKYEGVVWTHRHNVARGINATILELMGPKS